MNLKRLRGIASVALITIAAALIAGCSNSIAGSVDSGTGMATLSLSATGIPNDYAEQIRQAYSNAGRSIVPNAPYAPDTTGLVFYLSGSSETGVDQPDTQVKLVAKDATTWELTTMAGAPITLESRSWTLVLTAYKSYTAQGSADNKPVLRGFCTVDLRNGSGSASFVMGKAGLTTDGSVTLGGTIVDTDDAAVAYTMGIYRMDTGALVTGTGQEGTLESDNGGENEDFTYSKVTVEPGTYEYKMYFYADAAKKTKVGFFWDSIVVEPGNDLNKSDIMVDGIGKKPTPPTNLKAYLVDGSEPSDGTTYDVKVTWTQSDYATNYELNLVEFDGVLDDIATTFAIDATSKRIVAGKIYGMASMDKSDPPKEVEDFTKSKIGAKNSSTALMYGTESCTLTLETGKLYEIQLRARNDIGVSDWADRGAGGTETGCTAYAAPADQRINRLLVTYNLNGGTLAIPGGSPCTEYAAYYSWKAGDDSDLLAPATTLAAAEGDITLVKGGSSAFTEWKLEKGTAVCDTAIVTVADANLVVNKYTYKNATVKAFFGNTVSLGVSADAQTTYIKHNDIVITYGATNESPNVENNTAAYIIPKGTRDAPNSVKVSLTPASDNNTSPYKDVSFTVRKKDTTNITPATVSNKYCTFSTSDFSPGENVSVIVKATDATTGKLVTYTVSLIMK